MRMVNFTLCRIILSVSVALISLAVFMFVLYWQSSSVLKKSAENRMLHAMTQMETTIGNAYRVFSSTLKYSGAPCDEKTLQTLRLQVATVPDVRTVSLVSGRGIYCSSVYGEIVGEEPVGGFVNGQLLLTGGTPLTPNSPVLIVRAVNNGNEQGIEVGIDGYYIRNILALVSEITPVYIRIGDAVMSPQGKVTVDSEKETDDEILQQNSFQYPLVLFTPFTTESKLTYLKDNFQWLLNMALLVSGLVAYGCYYGTGLLNSPLRQLKRAISNKELEPWIQPVVTADGRLAGGEILVRWNHPARGVIMPGEFIPLAEENNLTEHLTQSLMKQVSRHFVSLRDDLPEGFHFAFNVSPGHFEKESLVKDCLDFLSTFSAGKTVSLVVEVTERQVIQTGKSQDVFMLLQQNGVLISLDDFGTGHSGLDYLRNYQFDFIKIDQSFVRDIVSKIHVGNIIQNIVMLATDLGMRTVAEGVESEAELTELEKLNIDYYQGYFFSRPLSLDVFTQQLREGEWPE